MTMKRGLPMAALSLILALQTGGVSAAPAKPAVTASHSEAVYQAFLPLLSSSGKLPDAIAYLSRKIYAVTPYQATMMVLRLENLHKAGLPGWEKRLADPSLQRQISGRYKPGDSFADLAEGLQNTSQRTLLLSAHVSGYKPETAEGSIFPVIDYDAYLKFKPYVTADIKDYLAVMAVEAAHPPAKDNGLVIAWTEVTERARTQEKFIRTHPKSNRTAQVKAIYSRYLDYTLYGLNNTPLFHYDNQEMDLEAEKAYLQAISGSNADSEYLRVLKGFMGLLADNGYKLDDAVESYRKEHTPKS